MCVVVSQHAPAQARRGQRPVLRVGRRAVERVARADDEERARGGCVDGHLRRRVPGKHLRAGRRRRCTSVVPDRERRGEVPRGGVGVRGRGRRGLECGRPVAETPLVGEGVTRVRIRAGPAVEVDCERRRTGDRRGCQIRRGRPVGRDRIGDPTHLPAVGVVRVVESLTGRRLRDRSRPERKVHDRTDVRGELRAREAASTGWGEQEDLSACVVAVEVRPVVGGGPDPVRHEGAARDRRTASDLVHIGVDRVRHPGGWRATVRLRARSARSLTHVPPVVGSRDAQVDLFPDVLTGVVDEEACPGGVRVERDPERVAQAPGVGLLALVAGCCATRGGAARRAGAEERVARRDRPRARDPQDLAEEHMLVARGVVPARAAAAVVVAAAVADAHVEVAVLREVEVAGVVLPVGRGDPVDQDGFARRGDHVAAHHKPRDPIDTGPSRVARVIEVDEAVRGEGRVDVDPKEPLFRVGADRRAQVQRRLGQQHVVGDDPQSAELRRDEDPAVGREGERRRIVDRRYERVRETRRDRGEHPRGSAHGDGRCEGSTEGHTCDPARATGDAHV